MCCFISSSIPKSVLSVSPEWHLAKPLRDLYMGHSTPLPSGHLHYNSPKVPYIRTLQVQYHASFQSQLHEQGPDSCKVNSCSNPHKSILHLMLSQPHFKVLVSLIWGSYDHVAPEPENHMPVYRFIKHLIMKTGNVTQFEIVVAPIHSCLNTRSPVGGTV